MKRLLCLLLAFTLLMACACLPAGAEHTHKWKDLDIIQQPTCTAPGSKIQGCTVCGVTRDAMIPALGHEFSQQVYTGYADCTHYGSFYWVCERCGAHSAIGNDKPLGHDWDEGVITTPPQGFTPGVKTYTCKRDPSHTYTEEVEPIEWVFATLENGIEFPDLINSPVDLKDIPPLVITKQPVGGYVARESDEGFLLTIEVEGGQPPYYYEWHKGYKDDSSKEAASALAYWLGGLLGFTEEEIYDMLEIEAQGEVGENEPFCYATEGGHSYWCVVYDEAGSEPAISDRVIMDYKIGIWTQPSRKNLTEGSPAYLECRAYGGSGEYTYEWFRWNDEEGDDFYMGSEMPLPVTEPGEYYCIAMDAVTGDTAESDDALVYEAPPLSIEVIEGDHTLWPEEKGMFKVRVSGGVPPYEGKFVWSFHDALPTSADDPSAEGAIFTAETEGAGWYTFDVKDSMVNLASANLYRNDREITIVRQPQSGILPSDGSGLPIDIEVADCKLPLGYVFYRDQKYLTEFESEEYRPDFTLYNPGQYYITIIDADGHSTDTDVFNLEREEFRVVRWTPGAEMHRGDESVKLTVAAKGGKEPYKYIWIREENDGTRRKTGEDSPELQTSMPGRYFCIVMDATRDIAYSPYMAIGYIGTQPIIIEQPQSVTDAVSNDDGTVSRATLTCYAISSTGDNSGLRYDWQRLRSTFPSIWSDYDYNARTTSPTLPGIYRCRISDIATGNYIYTNNVAVSGKLVFEKALAIGTPEGGSKPSQTYQFYFDGGLPPYIVELYCYFPQEQASELSSYGSAPCTLYHKIAKYSLKDLQPLELYLPVYEEYCDYSKTPHEKHSAVATWFVTVNDTSGQFRASDDVTPN